MVAKNWLQKSVSGRARLQPCRQDPPKNAALPQSRALDPLRGFSQPVRDDVPVNSIGRSRCAFFCAYSKLRPFVSGSCVAIKHARKNAAAHR